MQKHSFLFLGFFLLAAATRAQQTKKSLLYDLVTQKHQVVKAFTGLALFNEITSSPSDKTTAVLKAKLSLSLDKKKAIQAFTDKSTAISLSIPSGKGADWVLDMAQQDINTSHDFSFGTIDAAGNEKKNTSNQGLHYRGYINGDSTSFASFSIFANGQVMGIFCNREGNFTIGKLPDSETEYVLYKNLDLPAALNFKCSTPETSPIPLNKNTATLKPDVTLGVSPTLCKKINMYWEVDYKLFHNNFSNNMVATQNYIAGIFNQVATMYQNEGVLVELLNCNIDSCADIYSTEDAGSALNGFKARWNGLGNSFKGDISVLIDGGPTNNGGQAFLLDNNLCDRNDAFAYCDVFGAFNAVPVYSWDVHVLTHEIGHLLGSHHTHWCGWNTGPNGVCGAIDNCFTLEPGSACSTCSVTNDINNTSTSFTGTIMSYCHLINSVGVNLANGFGPLPRAAIRATINQSACTVSLNKWTGTKNTAWENTENWSCGSLPDANTQVVIERGLKNYPIITSNAICKSLQQEPGTLLRVNRGHQLNIVGAPAH